MNDKSWDLNPGSLTSEVADLPCGAALTFSGLYTSSSCSHWLLCVLRLLTWLLWASFLICNTRDLTEKMSCPFPLWMVKTGIPVEEETLQRSEGNFYPVPCRSFSGWEDFWSLMWFDGEPPFQLNYAPVHCIFHWFHRTAWHAGSQLPNQGSSLSPLRWKRRVLTTGLPGKSLALVCFTYTTYRLISSRCKIPMQPAMSEAPTFSSGSEWCL